MAVDGRVDLTDRELVIVYLVIQRNNDMPLHVLRHIAGLVKGGVIVCGPRPDGSDFLER